MRKWLLLATLCTACAPVQTQLLAEAGGSINTRLPVAAHASPRAGEGPATLEPAIATTPAPTDVTPAPAVVTTAAPEAIEAIPTAAPQIAVLLPQTAVLPTPQPTAIPTPTLVGPVAGIHEGGVVFAKDNPFGLPRSIGVGAPSGLLDKAGYGLLAASQPTPGQILLIDVLPYFATRLLVDGILGAVAAAGLEVGRDYVFEDHDKPGKFLTLRVDVLADHALLQAWRGKVADPARQLVGIRWTDAQHGQATFHTLANDDEAKRTYLATSFDQSAGTASVDLLVDDPHGDDLGGPQQSANHLELRTNANPPKGTPTFSVRSGLAIHKASEAATPSYVGIAANWLSDGRGAFFVALGNRDTQGKLVFWPVDNAKFGQVPPAPHDFYVGLLGKDLPRILIGPQLQAIVPADSELPTSLPADPGVGAPFDDPKLAFPR